MRGIQERWGVAANEYEVSLWSNENFQNLDYGDG